MKKIILLIGILVGLPLSMVAQDDMYFFSSPKKEEKKTVQPKKAPQNQSGQQTNVKRQQMSVFIPNEGSATVVIMDDKSKDLSEVDIYNRRGGSVIIEDDYQDPYAVQGRDGEWVNNGFQGNLNDFYDAEIAIKTRNPRYRVSVSSPDYWYAVHGLNSTEWNVYVDNFDAYIFPTFSNPAWSSWKFGPRYSFSFAFGRNSYWGGYYNSWYGGYYDPWYGWGGYYDPWYGGYYPGYWAGGRYPGYWGGGYYPGYWGGGYYGREYRNGRPVYRDNRRYESSNSSSRGNYGRDTSTSYRPSRTTRAGSSYSPSTGYRPSTGASSTVSNGVRVRSSSTTVRTSPVRGNNSYSRTTTNPTSNNSRGNYYTRPSNTSTNSSGYTRPSRVNTSSNGTYTRPSNTSTNGRSNSSYTRSSRTTNSSSYSRPSSTRSNSYSSGSSSSYSRSSSTSGSSRSTSTRSSGGGSSRTTRGR